MQDAGKGSESRWARIDALVRQLGSVLRVADATLSQSEETKRARAGDAIAEAAAAVETAIHEPDEEERVVRALNMIRRARELVESLGA